MNRTIKIACLAALPLAASIASAQVTLYEHEGFRGQAFATRQAINNLQRYGYNDRASSAIVQGGRWEVCTDANFRGDCRLLRPGSYESLTGMGLGDRVSSLRPASDNRQLTYAPDPLPSPNYEYRRRPEERTREVRITSSHAVYGTPEQRCWVERERVSGDRNRSGPNVGGAIIGGLLGGVLGHQIGGGRGKDIATGAGALGGAAIGANVGRNSDSNSYSQNVQHCKDVPGSGAPTYWEVTYNYRGQEHRAQLASAPGETITVNRDGEPRG
jgi:uncharacterized protein YcfJ